MEWTLVEPCCGSAALALHLLGAGRPLLPYQGSKWRFRRALEAVVRRLGFAGPPARVVLNDVSAWGVAMGAVLGLRQRLIAELRALGDRDPREVFDALHGGPVPADPARTAAEFLFLQRLSFSGKAVGIRDGRWSSPGFNVSSAYGLPATDRFGAVKPMVPSLLGVLERYDRDLVATEVVARTGSAPPPSDEAPGVLVYLDPPYAGATAYPDGSLGRDEVVALALAWAEAGAAVLVSEAEALPDLLAAGWTAERLTTGRHDTSPFRGKQEEWVTYRPPTERASSRPMTSRWISELPS